MDKSTREARTPEGPAGAHRRRQEAREELARREGEWPSPRVDFRSLESVPKRREPLPEVGQGLTAAVLCSTLVTAGVIALLFAFAA
jgi:hypothetical protein